MPSAYANEELWVNMPQLIQIKLCTLLIKDILPFVAARPLHGHDKAIGKDGESVHVSTIPVTVTSFPNAYRSNAFSTRERIIC